MEFIKVTERMPEENQKVLFWCQWADLPCAGEYRRKRWDKPDSPLIFFADVYDYVRAEGGWDGAVLEQDFDQESVLAWAPIGDFDSHQNVEV